MTFENTKCRMASKINLDILFIIMIVISLIITYAFYMAWNRPHYSIPTISTEPLQTFHVDSCVFGEKDIMVKGWAFAQNNPQILNRIYAIKNDGTMVELMSSTVPRPDVSAAFNTPFTYDFSGFTASRRDHLSRSNFSHELMVVSVDNKGIGHAAKYQCQ
ncbi:hypothetical protein [Type-C symbiont of Plautia stali]|uniref:hypothetical protein n=1 Tax=Pantoea sp. TaxID=69393 RepID=UPI00128F5971